VTAAEQYRTLLASLDEELADVYRRRRSVMEAFAAEHPVVLPPARRRSEAQQKVARCPRCGGRLSDEQ
jgi:hypothetical protein